MRRFTIISFFLIVAAGIDAQPTVPLYTWYSPSRGDYFTTSDPAWAGRSGDRKSPDYTFVRLEGQVFNPRITQPDAVPLYSWWNPTRGDNFLTSDPVWRGQPGDSKDGYTLTRIEGFVYRTAVAGMVPLHTFWNRALQDNYATTDPRYAATGPRDYSGPGLAGYIFPSEQHAPHTLADFGYGTLKVNNRAAEGRRPLLVLLVDFANARFRDDRPREYYNQLIFGPGFPNIADYYWENSSNRFTWQSAGTLGPIRATDVPGTSEDESRFAGGMFDSFDARGRRVSEGRRMAARALTTAVTQLGFDLARYDTNRDGTVTTDELSILMIHAGIDDNEGAANRSMEPARVHPAGSPVATESRIAIAGDGASFTSIAHEIFHSLGANWDLYGSGSHSSGLTLMGDTIGGGREVRGTFHLDPWYKMRLGWIAPRIVPLNNNGDVTEISAPQVVDPRDPSTRFTRRPVLLYDATKGTGEFFIVEYRNAAALGGGYDRFSDWRGNTSGVAVWNAKVDSSGNPLGIPGIKITWGDNERLESLARHNDTLEDTDGNGVNDQVHPGPDRELQSVPGGDDRYWDDQAVLLRGAPNGRRGDAALLREADGDMVVDYLRTAAAPSVKALRVRSGRSSADGTKAWVEWSIKDPLIPRIDYSVGPGTAGSTVTLRGLFGVAQGPRVVSLYDADRGTYNLPVTSWTPNEVIARVPAGVPPGEYDLVIYTDSTRRSQSNWRAFEVRP
jgi:M6 family metalloprotease-like protein